MHNEISRKTYLGLQIAAVHGKNVSSHYFIFLFYWEFSV